MHRIQRKLLSALASGLLALLIGGCTSTPPTTAQAQQPEQLRIAPNCQSYGQALQCQWIEPPEIEYIE